MRRACAALVCAVAVSVSLGACATEVPAEVNLPDAVALSYKAVPLFPRDPKARRIGRLIYRGGLDISSPDARFGGWSGLVVSADGRRLLSQSDEAHWLHAGLVYDANGNLAGVDHAQLADMLDMAGKTMSKEEGDAEGLDALTPAGPDGPVAVSFEREDRVWRYDLSNSLDAMPTPIPTPEAIRSLRYNQGLEGLAALAPGALLAVSEDTRDAAGDMEAWLVSDPAHDADTQTAQLGVVPHPPYEISDAAMGPSGKHLYLLERHYFGPIGGIAIAVRQIDAGDIKAGARLGGVEIAKFDMHETIDNMEGLALRRDANGKTFLYMISDDNYDHVLQRTLLLMFELAPSNP